MKISRMIGAAMALAVALAAVEAPTGATALAETRAIELRATNHIQATATGYAEVTIPRPATVRFSFFDNPDVRLKGGGRFTGLFLVQQRVERPAAIYAARLRHCYEPGCKSGYGWFFMFPTGIKWKRKLVVPAGDYRLYAVVDGAPLSATLKLGGLTGKAEVRPTHRVYSEVGTSAAGLPVNNVYSGGSTYRLPGKGLAMLAFSNESSASVAEIDGDCLYKGRPPVDEAIAYAPGCTAHGAEEGHGVGFSAPPIVTSGGSASLSFRLKLGAGKWSYGGSWVAPQQVDFAAFTSLWMAYD